jgi:hypothetical protein
MSFRMRARRLTLLVVGLGLLGAAACGGGGDGGGSPDFAAFADQIARAAERGDIAFFIDRVQGETHTCTEEEVAASTGPSAPPEPICLEVGYQFEAIAISNYGTAGAITTPEVLARDIARFFENALSEEEDEYGPGDVRLYATAVPAQAEASERGLHTAILTGIQNASGVPGRFVRGLDFEYVDSDWMIRSETTAGFPIAAELLEPSSAVLLYEDWMKY